MTALLDTWLIFALVVACGSAGYSISMKYVKTPNPYFFLSTLSFTLIVMNLVILAGFAAFAKLPAQDWAIVYAPILCGLGAFTINTGNVLMFRTGAKVSIGLSLTRIGLTVTSTIIGLTLFEERISAVNAAGIILACIAIYLLSRDNKKQSV